MRSASAAASRENKRIGIVPTMGYLHEGHLSLIEIAKLHCDIVVMTLFVNPTQFSPSEDFSVYPRSFADDSALAAHAGVNILFAPEAKEMYPADFDIYVCSEKFGTILEGSFRPAHFKGVLTIVAKLFHIVNPQIAVFGQKDYQQAFLIKKMTRDLDFDVEIVVVPIVREHDGLAMSSRNVYLSPTERTQARALSHSLKIAEKLIAEGERSATKIIATMKEHIIREQDARIDYIAITEPETLAPIEQLLPDTMALVVLAVHIGTTRLIDNILIHIKH